VTEVAGLTDWFALGSQTLGSRVEGDIVAYCCRRNERDSVGGLDGINSIY